MEPIRRGLRLPGAAVLAGSGCMSEKSKKISRLTDWNDECRKRVATNNTSIEHDVLRNHLPITYE